MNVKKIVLIMLLVSAICAGCTVQVVLPSAEASSNGDTATPLPDVTAAPPPDAQLDPSAYAVDKEYTIVYVPDGTVVYDITYDFPNRWDYWISNLAVEPEALYFTEGGYHLDSDPDYEGEYTLARINGDGSGYTVLHTMSAVDYLQIVPYGDKIFFVSDGWDSVAIGWAYRDGSGSGWLDLSDYAANYGADEYWLGAAYLYPSGDALYADITIGLEDESTAEHTISIGTDLSVQYVSG
jgi:hypothetical protein